MTRLVLSAVLVLSSPVAPVPSAGSEAVQPAAVAFPAAGLNPHETEDWWLTDVSIAATEPPTSYFDWSTLPVPEPMALFAAIASPAVNEPPPPMLTDGELVDAIFGWPGPQLVQCESNWNRWAVGRFGERGLFQIHPLWIPEIRRLGWTWDQMWEAEPNIRMAAHIRRVQGLRAWTCWKG